MYVCASTAGSRALWQKLSAGVTTFAYMHAVATSCMRVFRVRGRALWEYQQDSERARKGVRTQEPVGLLAAIQAVYNAVIRLAEPRPQVTANRVRT
jgi:hypothetical protein